MKYISTILFLFTTALSFAQDSTPIISSEQNTQWLHELKERDLAEKLEMIKSRWEVDTAVVYYPTAIPHEKASGDIRRTKSRPLYLFTRSSKGRIIFSSNPSSEVIAEVSKMLFPEKISDVRIETDLKKVALYGTRGQNGVIYLEVAEDADFAYLKKILYQ